MTPGLILPRDPHLNIMIHAFIFTYKRNALQAIESALAVQQTLPEAHVSLIDDSNNPWTPEALAKAKEAGVEYRTSDFNRRGNLNGHSAVVGILETLIQDKPDENDLLIKIDADTAVIGDSFIQPLLEDPELSYSFCGSKWHVAHGCAYVIRAKVAYTMLEALQGFELPPKSPEDIVIGDFAISRFQGRVFSAWSYLFWTSRWTAWNWDPKTTAKFYAEHFDVITTGNPCGKANPDEARAEVIRNLREEKKKLLQKIS